MSSCHHLSALLKYAVIFEDYKASLTDDYGTLVEWYRQDIQSTERKPCPGATLPTADFK